jgi:diadenosine tetraphosphate (Ap4A) HIT family hydrolase
VSSDSNLDSCMVCTVIQERRYMERTEHGVVYRPDNALAEGHLIVAPLTHVVDALANPVITAQVMRLAAMKAKKPCIMLIQNGAEAGQKHAHMYVHIYPADDVKVIASKKAAKS